MIIWVSNTGEIREITFERFKFLHKLLGFLQSNDSWWSTQNNHTIDAATSERWGRAISRQFFNLRLKDGELSLTEGDFINPTERAWLADIMSFLIHSNGINQVTQ